MPEDAAAADDAIRTADAVIVTGYGRLDAGRVGSLERAVGILCYSIGMDKVDGPAAKAAGIPVRNVPDYCTDEVSDHALTLLLAAQRRILPFATATAAGGWPNGDRTLTGSLRRLRGQTLGIAGAGRIGRLVAAKARAFGFRTVAYDPFTDRHHRSRPAAGRPRTSCSRRPTRSSCAPPTRPVPRRSSRARRWPGSSPGSSSSTSRAAVTSTRKPSPRRCVDGRVAVAALDVRTVEPPDPARDPLSGLPNVVLTPHVAGSSREAVDDLHRLAAEYVLDLLEAGGRISVAA